MARKTTTNGGSKQKAHRAKVVKPKTGSTRSKRRSLISRLKFW